LKSWIKYKFIIILAGFLILFTFFSALIPIKVFSNLETSQGVNLTIHCYDQRIPGVKNITADFLASPLGSGVDSVTVVSSGSISDNILTYLTTLMQSGTATADIIDLDVLWTALFAENGWIIPLDSYLEVNELDAYAPGIVNACLYKGSVYAYPYFMNLGILYYRKDLLDLHYGTGMWSESDFDTWQELNQTANYILNNQSGLLTSDDSNLVGYVGQFDAYEGGVVNFFEWCGSNGALDLISGEDEVNINSTAVTEAMTFLKALIPPQYTGVQGTPYIIPRSGLIHDEGASVSVWLANNSIFMRQWPFAYKSSINFNINFGLVPLPHFEGISDYKTSVVGGSILAIPQETTGTAREAAINFTKFLGDPLAQERELTADVSPDPGVQPLSNFPALMSVYSNPPAGFEWIENWTDQLLLTLSRPIHEDYPSISNTIADYFNDMLSCQKSVSEALDGMQYDILKLISQLPEIYVEIVDKEYTAENFKIIFYLTNATGDPINNAAIQMWWNGTDVSSSIQNHGNGNYSVNLIPITILPGEDPILLNMSISAAGYEDNYFELYIAVEPDLPGNEIIPGYQLVLFYCVFLASIIIIYYKVKPKIKK